MRYRIEVYSGLGTLSEDTTDDLDDAMASYEFFKREIEKGATSLVVELWDGETLLKEFRADA
jgi:hypothetical protein